MIAGLIFVSGILLFCLLGSGRALRQDSQGKFQGMTDFSDGWICVYETDDEKRLEEFRNSGDSDNFKDNPQMIQEINSFPAVLPVLKNKAVAFFHRTPEIRQEEMYLFLETDRQSVQVSVDEKIIYQSAVKEKEITAYHLVPLRPEYNDEMIRIELSGNPKGDIQVHPIYAGTKNQVFMYLLFRDGPAIATGILWMLVALCMIVVLAIMKNTWRQKRLLVYISMESLGFGLFFLLSGETMAVLTGMNYGLYLLRACLGILTGIMHIMVMRCFMRRKKMLAFLDTGILLYGICYISAMVLTGFSLIDCGAVFIFSAGLFAICVLLYTVVLTIAMGRYRQKECVLPLTGNIIILAGMGLQFAVRFLHIQENLNNMWYLMAGLLIYSGLLGFVGLRQALYAAPAEKEKPYDEQQIKNQLIERINPNLLFAAFHSLQSLMKNGAESSTRMLYYISVYFRDNLNALQKAGEMIPFEEELEHIIAYLQLQKMRNTGLSFHFECKVKEFRVPRHTLEPMVENAVKYGISGKHNQGNVAVKTYLRAEGYAIQIIDDGIGFDENGLTRKSPTALLNLFDELKTACNAQTEIISKENKGTVITIVLPMLENDMANETEEIEITE